MMWMKRDSGRARAKAPIRPRDSIDLNTQRALARSPSIRSGTWMFLTTLEPTLAAATTA